MLAACQCVVLLLATGVVAGHPLAGSFAKPVPEAEGSTKGATSTDDRQWENSLRRGATSPTQGGRKPSSRRRHMLRSLPHTAVQGPLRKVNRTSHISSQAALLRVNRTSQDVYKFRGRHMSRSLLHAAVQGQLQKVNRTSQIPDQVTLPKVNRTSQQDTVASVFLSMTHPFSISLHWVPSGTFQWTPSDASAHITSESGLHENSLQSFLSAFKPGGTVSRHWVFMLISGFILWAWWCQSSRNTAGRLVTGHVRCRVPESGPQSNFGWGGSVSFPREPKKHPRKWRTGVRMWKNTQDGPVPIVIVA